MYSEYIITSYATTGSHPTLGPRTTVEPSAYKFSALSCPLSAAMIQPAGN